MIITITPTHYLTSSYTTHYTLQIEHGILRHSSTKPMLFGPLTVSMNFAGMNSIFYCSYSACYWAKRCALSYGSNATHSCHPAPPAYIRYTLHCNTLLYTTLHYTTLHYTTLHSTTLHYTTLYRARPAAQAGAGGAAPQRVLCAVPGMYSA